MKWLWLNRLSVLLSCVGIAIAGRLTWHYINAGSLPCDSSGGCEAVTKSPAAYLFHIPVAYIGLASYLALLLLALIRGFHPAQPNRLFGFGYLLSIIGTAFSLYLTYYSLKVLGTHCIWCIGSAATMSLTLACYGGMANSEPHEKAGEGALVTTLCAGCILCFASIMPLLEGRNTAPSYDPAMVAASSEEELIPNDAHMLGNTAAKTSIVMFGDLTCPACQETFPKLQKFVGSHRDVRLVFRHLPLTVHPQAYHAAVISELAAAKGKFFDFVSAGYTASIFSKEDIIALAKKYEISKGDCAKAWADKDCDAQKRVARDNQLSIRLKFRSTPTILVSNEGFTPIVIPLADVDDMLNKGTNLHPPSSAKPS